MKLSRVVNYVEQNMERFDNKTNRHGMFCKRNVGYAPKLP